MPWDFDRKMASPTESAVRLDQADREHSGAGILNRKTVAGRSLVGIPGWHPLCAESGALVLCRGQPQCGWYRGA